MGKLKGVLGKALSAVAVIGVAAVGVAAVITVGSLIGRKGKSGVTSSDSEASDFDQEDFDEHSESQPRIDDPHRY